jgi:hypothetical protein
MGWGRAQYLCFLLQRKLQGLDLVKLLAFECFLPAHPKPSSKQPRKTKQARQSPSACVAALWSRIYAPLPAPPSVNCLIVSGVQHSVGFGWPTRAWCVDSRCSAAAERRVDVPCRCSPTFIVLLPRLLPHLALLFSLRSWSFYNYCTHLLPLHHIHIHTQGRTGKDAAPERRRAWRR